MEQIKFYRGGSSVPSTMDTNGLYFTTTGRLYDGKTKQLIGQSLDKLSVGNAATVPNYSIVGGTNDKAVMEKLLGSLAAMSLNVAKPTSNAEATISYGAGTIVNTAGSNAIGTWNTAGVKGYYWSKVTFNSDGTVTFALTSNQSASILSPGSIASTDWVVGDIVSIIDKAHFPRCGKIKALGTTTQHSKTTVQVTIEAIDSSTPIPFTSEEDITLKTPQNKTICAFYLKQEVNYLNKLVNNRWCPRNGVIDIGWGTTCLGVENLSSGSGGLASGWNNWNTSSFGFVGGS